MVSVGGKTRMERKELGRRAKQSLKSIEKQEQKATVRVDT
jgi:hypothetical protein